VRPDVVREVWRIAASAARLKCPRCGGGPIFTGAFRMRRFCAGCGLVFEREPGYFIGSIYLNYGLTTVLMIAGYFALEKLAGFGPWTCLALCGLFGIIFPLLFFRHARTLWLAVDQFLDPSDAGGARRV
jgi:uncharacterized protein (DUF983 family)